MLWRRAQLGMALGARAEPEAQLYAARGMPQNGAHGTGATAGHRTGLGAMRTHGRDWAERARRHAMWGARGAATRHEGMKK